MTNLNHAVGFLQNAYTIILALALSEAFKQFVADSGKRDIFWNRSASLVGFLFMIFPFFHGMSRYLFTTYLAPGAEPKNVAVFLMFDGIMFMLMSACFFIMSRSLQPDRWQRYFGALALLLIVDSIWIGGAVWRGVDVWVWAYLNAVLAAVMVIVYFKYKRKQKSLQPPIICAITICATTIASYIFMQDFYFP